MPWTKNKKVEGSRPKWRTFIGIENIFKSVLLLSCKSLRLASLMMYITSYFIYFSRWVQTECRKLGDTDNPEVSELLKTAVRYLKERSVLFKYCAEEVISLWIFFTFLKFVKASLFLWLEKSHLTYHLIPGNIYYHAPSNEIVTP